MRLHRAPNWSVPHTGVGARRAHRAYRTRRVVDCRNKDASGVFHTAGKVNASRFRFATMTLTTAIPPALGVPAASA
jgi:hypothetical protein